MKKLIALLLALVMLFSLVGCSTGYSEEDLTAAKEAAYDEGYEAGYTQHELDHECEYTESDVEDAYSDGYRDAENDHECEYNWSDVDDARIEGKREGYDEGYDDGFSAGYDDGYEDGKPQETRTDETVTSGASGYGGGSGVMVWIPNSGSKYHSNANCSGMKNPTLVSKENAISWGYGACKKCY